MAISNYAAALHCGLTRNSTTCVDANAAVMDACALIMVGLKDMRPFEARMPFEMARLTVLEMSRVFETTPVINVDRLSRTHFAQLAACLTEGGLAGNHPDDARGPLSSL